MVNKGKKVIIERELLNEIKKVIERKEIIAIRGPRQSGKTTFIKEILIPYLLKNKKAKKGEITYLTFEDIEILEKFSENPKEFIRTLYPKSKFIFIDEYHYYKNGKTLKMLYDLFDEMKFIITGSSSLELTFKTAKYLVGRVFYFDLLNLRFFEFLNFKNKELAKYYYKINQRVLKFIEERKDFEIMKKEDIFLKDLLRLLEEYVIYGAYPEVVKSEVEIKKLILKNIIETYFLRDVRELLNEDIFKFRKILTYLASNLGGILNYVELSNFSSTYFKYIVKVLDILEETYIIKLLRPYHFKLSTELRKSPKVYFFDTGLRNYLINNFNNFVKRNDTGVLIENFVLSQLSRKFEKINYWRTKTKSEIDFIIDFGYEQIPIEVKFKNFSKPKITSSLKNFIEKYSPEVAIIFTKDFWGETKFKNCKIKLIPVVYV